jgi:hypothetical protein
MTGFVRVRLPIRGLALVAVLSLAAALAPPARAADSEAVTRPIAESNTALLARAAEGVARQLVAGLPLSAGTRVGLRQEGTSELQGDMREAILRALNGRRITCVLLEPAAAEVPPDTATAAAADAAARPTGPGGSATTPPGSESSTDLAELNRQAAETQRTYESLQAERAAQAARADSVARAAGANGAPAPAERGAPTTVLATQGQLPVLTWRVQEARVDYVRSFRGGIFGAQRVERRARADLALRLTPAGSDAISWSAAADTALGDVVLKSELAALEDRTRPETRPQLPSSSFKKVLEPALVVLLVAGLVSLFYQNRP